MSRVPENSRVILTMKMAKAGARAFFDNADTDRMFGRGVFEEAFIDIIKATFRESDLELEIAPEVVEFLDRRGNLLVEGANGFR